MRWLNWFKRDVPGPAHLATGVWGEKIAMKHLKRQGYRIVGTRVRVGRRDEIDIIAQRDEVLIFVEVKTRADERMGRPVAAVDRRKRDRLGRAAMRYMRSLRIQPPYFRFDVIEVIGSSGDRQPEVRHLENVFQLPKGMRVPW